MNKSKKVSIGIGIGILVGVAVIVFAFTNIGDLLSQELTEYTSEVKLTNPIQSYNINTECDFVNFLFVRENQGKLLRFLQQNYDAIQQKWLEKGDSLEHDKAISTIREISVKMIVNEFSINPKLTNFVSDTFSETSTSKLIYQAKLLSPNCEIYESTAKANKEFITRSQTQSSSKIPEGAEVLGTEHSHAAILVKVFGDTFNFSLPTYQIKSSWIHFEGGDGTTIHKHATGVKLGYLFDSLRLTLDDKCFVLQDGRQFCTNEDYTLNFYINGEKVSNIVNYEPMDKDRILIVYGAETSEEIQDLLSQLDMIESGDAPVEKLPKDPVEEESNAPDDEASLACTREYVPVCGVDGFTYRNMCILDAAKIKLDYKSECGVAQPESTSEPEPPIPAMPTPQTHTVKVTKESATPGCEETHFCYEPYSITVDKDTTVSWHNADSAAHTVTSGSPTDGSSGVFDSSLFMAGATFSHKFTESGTFPYYCMIHPWMVGIVIVE